jgi:hypothetical protein
VNPIAWAYESSTDFNPETAPRGGSYYLPLFEAAARSLKVEPIAAPVHSDAEIETAIASLGREPRGGLVVPGDAVVLSHSALKTIYPRCLMILTSLEMAVCCRSRLPLEYSGHRSRACEDHVGLQVDQFFREHPHPIDVAASECNTATCGSWLACCARTASGHAAVPLPTRVMKSRRLIGRSQAQETQHCNGSNGYFYRG